MLAYPVTLVKRHEVCFDPPGPVRYKRKFVQTLDDLRTELGFRIIGYVLIPQGGTPAC